MKYVIIFITFLILFPSCATTLKMTTSGGFGKNVDEFNYQYKLQNMHLHDLYSEIFFEIKITKFDNQSPIEPDLNYIINCLQVEIENNGGYLISKKDKFSDILIDITLSKYITRNFGKNYYKSFIDLEYKIYDNISSKTLVLKPISISGNGTTASESNLISIQKITREIILNDEIKKYLSNIQNSNDNKISHFINRLSKNLLTDFEQSYFSQTEEINLAFVGFKQDNKNLFSNIFLTCLKNFWKKPKYNFFSRDQIDKIIDEYKLSMAGLVEDTAFLKRLELKSVEFLITGNVSNINERYIVEAQIINITNGEIVTAKSASVIL